MSLDRQSVFRLRWQSQLPLYLVVALGTASIALRSVAFSRSSPATIIQASILGAFLALLTWRFRAATPAAALAGGLFATALYTATPGWRTALWPLLALLVLTLAATRFGRARKEKIGVAESRRGRTASQVAANLGVAVLASVPLGLAHYFPRPPILAGHTLQLALVAALAEAAADTLSSELGEVLGGEPRLLTSLRPVPAGTDGAISFAGTLAGFSGAIVVGVAGAVAFALPPAQATIVVVAAFIGLFVDSFLGAVFERRGWLNNDAVNFLSTLASALLALALGRRY
jgi:uncharacterized protein (TIGR00297 family)